MSLFGHVFDKASPPKKRAHKPGPAPKPKGNTVFNRPITKAKNRQPATKIEHAAQRKQVAATRTVQKTKARQTQPAPPRFPLVPGKLTKPQRREINERTNAYLEKKTGGDPTRISSELNKLLSNKNPQHIRETTLPIIQSYRQTPKSELKYLTPTHATTTYGKGASAQTTPYGRSIDTSIPKGYDYTPGAGYSKQSKRVRDMYAASSKAGGAGEKHLGDYLKTAVKAAAPVVREAVKAEKKVLPYVPTYKLAESAVKATKTGVKMWRSSAPGKVYEDNVDPRGLLKEAGHGIAEGLHVIPDAAYKAAGSPGGSGTKAAYRFTLDPSNWIPVGGQAGAAAKGAGRAIRAVRALEHIGVDATDLSGTRALINEGARTRDFTKLGDHLEAAHKSLKGRPDYVAATFKGSRQEKALRAVEEAATPQYTKAVKGTKRDLAHGLKKSAKEDIVVAGERGTPAAAQDAVDATHLNAILNSRSRGISIGLHHPLKAHTRTGRLSANFRFGSDVFVGPSRAAKEAFVAEAGRKVRERFVPALREINRALNEPGVTASSERGQILLRKRKEIEDAYDLAKAREIPTVKDVKWTDKIPANLQAEATNGRMAARLAYQHSAAASRASEGAYMKNLQTAIAPLVHAKVKGEELDLALKRVGLELRRGEAHHVNPDLFPRYFKPNSVKDRAERAAYDNIRTLYDQMGEQGVSHGFLRSLRESYAGTRSYGGAAPESLDQLLASGGVAGTTGKFAAARKHSSAAELAHRAGLIADIAEAHNIPDTAAARLADELHRGGESRFNAEMVARKLERNDNNGLVMDDLSPPAQKAVREWGAIPKEEEHALPVDENKRVFRLDDHGKVYLVKHDNLLSGEEKVASAKQDYGRYQRYFHDRLTNPEAMNTDLQHYSDQLSALNDELPVPTGSEANQAHNNILRQLDINSGGPFIDQGGDLAGIKTALRGINPHLVDVPVPNPRGFGPDVPLTMRLVRNENGGLGSYEPSSHEILINAAHSPVNSTDPASLAQLRTTLFHEIGHAHSMNPGADQALSLAQRAGTRNYHPLAEKNLIERGVVDDLKNMTDAQMEARSPELTQRQSALVNEEAARLKKEAVNTAIGEESVANLNEVHAAFKAHAPPTATGDPFDRVLRRMAHIESPASSYAQAIRRYGPELVKAREASASAMELLALNEPKFRAMVGDRVADWMQNDILRVQLTDLDPVNLKNLKLATRPDGVQMVVPKGAKDSPLPAHGLGGADQAVNPHEAGPFDDPADVLSRLPDLRSKEHPLRLDPAADLAERISSQGRTEAANSFWRAIDKQYGRSLNDKNLTVIGATRDEHGRVLPGHGEIYQDENGIDYILPVARNNEQDVNIQGVSLGHDRVWPAQAVANAQYALLRGGAFDVYAKSGINTTIRHYLSHARLGVTVPFPAYHIRNMASDLLASIQVDSTILFHPSSLVIAASGPYRTAGTKKMLNVPGFGQMKMQDFLLLADMNGVRSAEHLTDFAAGLKAHSKPVQFALNQSARREDTIRLATFHHRLRANGGDAAEAANHMIETHFDYSDLSQNQRRIARNVILFYTWYRKNIPRQLSMLARRPGFFAAVGNTYGLAAQNIDQPPFRPEYLSARLMAAPISAGGHAVYAAFGAPWADLNYVTPGGEKNIPSAINPWLSALTKLGLGLAVSSDDRSNWLTGQHIGTHEKGWLASATGSLADVMRQVGVDPGHVLKDRNGNYMLPWWLTELSNLEPGAARAGTASSGKGILGTLEGFLMPVSLNSQPGKKGTKEWNDARNKAYYFALLDLGRAQRDINDDHTTLGVKKRRLREYEDNTWLPRVKKLGFNLNWVRKTYIPGQQVGHPYHYLSSGSEGGTGDAGSSDAGGDAGGGDQ